MMNVALQMIIYCVILVVLAIPLGSYMGKVMNGERVFLSRRSAACGKPDLQGPED